MMHLTSSCLRSTLTAGPGKKLISADLSNIEGRYLAWAAGEEWKIQAFRDFDNGTGADLYKLAYAKSFKISPDKVDKNQRSIGKVQELALGYAGGVGAFLTFAAAYSINLEEMANMAYDSLPAEVVKEAEGFYDWNVKNKNNTYGLSKKAYIVCESFKRLWRQAHPMTVALWAGLSEICVNATVTVNKNYVYGKFKARRDGQWLRLTMPSGRSLCFPYPQVDERGTLSFMGMNQYTRKWERIVTHGGKLAENICQAGARDIFKYGIKLADDAGYPLVLAVHDEQVCEVPDTEEYTVSELERLMAVVPEWATGIPLAAEGFETYRYKK
jgi:DNA polymerase